MTDQQSGMKDVLVLGCLALVVCAALSAFAYSVFNTGAIKTGVFSNQYDEEVTFSVDIGKYTDRQDGILFFGDDQIAPEDKHHSLLGTSNLTLKHFDVSGVFTMFDFSGPYLCASDRCVKIDNMSDRLRAKLYE